jgi:IclR family pca regulon transcriptional regulator
MGLNDIAQPVIDDVSQKTGASSSIAVLDKNEIIFVARSPAKGVIKVQVGIGARLPAYTTSLGKVLLASLPQDRLNKVLTTTKFVPTQNMKKTTAAELRKELNLVRVRGYATSVGMLDYAIASVAVPILDARQRTVAAINISTNVRKLKEPGALDRFVKILGDASERISIGIRTAPDSVLGLLEQG